MTQFDLFVVLQSLGHLISLFYITHVLTCKPIASSFFSTPWLIFKVWQVLWGRGLLVIYFIIYIVCIVWWWHLWNLMTVTILLKWCDFLEVSQLSFILGIFAEWWFLLISCILRKKLSLLPRSSDSKSDTDFRSL